jgi:hypothetical protein
MVGSGLNRSSLVPMDNSIKEVPRRDGTSPDGSPLTGVQDWGSLKFFSVDSLHTVRHEDAIDISALHRGGSPDTWHLDLKVIHALPTEIKASLPPDKPSICLGFSDEIRGPRNLKSSLSLVVATNSCRLVDSEAASVRLPDPKQLGYRAVNSGDTPADVVEKLTLLRLAALRVSFFKDRELRPEHAVNLILDHTQRRALRVARDLPQSPPLVVLRSAGFRELNQREAREHFGFEVKVPRVMISAGPKTQTIVRQSDSIRDDDGVRIKQNTLSGLVNSVQIACCLMGIEPIPVESIEGCLPEGGRQDKLNHLTTVPEKLRNAIEERQGRIREVLSAYAPKAAQSLRDNAGD